jgi:hypothetical protein
MNNLQNQNRSSQFAIRNSQFAILIFLLVQFIGFEGYGQGFVNVDSVITPQSQFDDVADRLGNIYKLQNLKLQSPTFLDNQTNIISTDTVGYFIIDYNYACGMNTNSQNDSLKRNVILRVFEDISNFILTPIQTNYIRIKIVSQNSIPTNGLQNGWRIYGSSYYSVPKDQYNLSGIVDSKIWESIVSGKNAWNNIVTPLWFENNSSGNFYHAFFTFNFSSYSSSEWYTDLTNQPGMNDYDMYSGMLKEVLHTLGISSFILDNGESVLGNTKKYYTRFDRHLKQNGLNLISNSLQCSMYSPQIDTSIVNSIGIGGSCIPDFTDCNNSIYYEGSTNITVYNPNCFQLGSSLSSLEDICLSPNQNNTYFATSNITPLGINKRYPKEQERNILSDLGYQIGNSYGNISRLNHYQYLNLILPIQNPIGIVDGINSTGGFTWVVKNTDSIVISGNEILDNDYFGNQTVKYFSCLEEITGLGTVSISYGDMYSNIQYTPNANSKGTAVLRYIPVMANGNVGNITYIYIEVFGVNCSAPCGTNLVVNGDFESAICTAPFGYIDVADCWGRLKGSADIAQYNCNPPGDIWNLPNNLCTPPTETYNGQILNQKMAGFVGIQNNNSDEEWAQEMMSGILTPGIYTLNYKVKIVTNFPASPLINPARIGIVASNQTTVPILPNGGGLNIAALNPANYYIIEQGNTIQDNSLWHFYSYTFTVNAGAPANMNRLLIGYEMDPLFYFNSYFYLDDLEILPGNNVVSFNTIPCVNVNSILTNLAQYVNVTSITPLVFTGQGVVLNGAQYDFNSTIVGVGTHLVVFYYTDPQGCPRTGLFYITVSPPLNLQLTSLQSSLCLGESTTITATTLVPTTNNWNPGGMSGNSNIVTPSSSTIYTVIATDGAGCTATSTISITVNPLPIVNILASPPCIPSVLTASGASTYNWMPGNINGNPITASTVGIYTVIGTDINGCTGTSTVSISNSFTATIWNLSASNCDPKELFATPLGAGYSYQWTNAPGGPILSSTSTCPVPFGTVATYTVVVTDANGCTASSTFAAYALPVVNVTATPSQMQCTGIPSNLLASPTNYVSYSWLPTTGLNSSTIFNPIATVTATTVYTVTVTDVNGCIGNSWTTITLGNQDFCCSPAASIIANDPATILLDNTDANDPLLAGFGGIIPAGQVLFINGTFLVNQPMVFDGCTVYFTPNSKIDLPCNQNLELKNGATLQSAPGCDMWDGIYSSCNTSIIDINSGAMLRDMINGVCLAFDAQLYSDGAFYTENRISIQIKLSSNSSNYSIINNQFNSTLGLIAPYAGDKPRFGISMYDSRNLSIGTFNNPNSGNEFSNLWCGIYIENTVAATYSNPTISLNHNRFTNIVGDANSWGAQLNTNTRGWCIYGANLSPVSNINVDVNGALNTTIPHFQNSDKGILLRRMSGRVIANTMDNTIVGILMTECQGREYKIQNNTIDQTGLGICKTDDENSNGLYVYLNKISLVNSNPTQLNVNVSTGIMSRYSSNSNIGISNIVDNTIVIPLEQGIGISLNNGSKDNISGNKIHLTAPNGNAPNPPAVPDLIGIYSNNSIVPLFYNNTVDNNNLVNGNTTYVPGNNAGIYLTGNTESKLSCNKTNYLKYGILAAGINGSQTDYQRTIGNFMRCEDADLIFWQLGTDGTLGVIGKEVSLTPYVAFNANNTFLAGTGLNKVYRLNTTICNLGGITEGITTTFPQLNPAQSSALTNNLGCAYAVINPLSGFTSGHYCNSNNMLVSGSFGEDDFDAELAAQIAQGQLEYEEEFDQGASRIHEELLFAWLHENDTVLNTHPLLDSFYLARFNTTVGQLVNIDLLISKLSDSLLISTPLAWQATLNDAKMYNNAISPQATFDDNTKVMNTLYLKTIEYGIDTLTTLEQETIAQLANACPLIAGNGVYRARTLQSMIQPGIHYDDIVICNSQGVYKNGLSKLQQQLDKLSNDRSKNILEGNFIRVYPVPAFDKLNINYSLNNGEKADFILYDVLGSKLQTISLNDTKEIETIDLSSYASGVYTYQYLREGYAHQTGKIIISK